MQKFTKEELNPRFKQAFDNRNQAIAKANGTQDSQLWGDFFEKEIYFNYINLLYIDSGIDDERDPEISRFLNPKSLQMSLRDRLYSFPNEEDFIKTLEKTPHEDIYSQYMECALNEIVQLQNGFSQQFVSGKNEFTFSNDRMNQYMGFIDCIYPRPILLLNKLIKLQEENDRDVSVLREIAGSLQSSFEQGPVDASNEGQIKLLEDIKKGEFSNPNLNIIVSASPEKMDEFIEKIKFSDNHVQDLYVTSCKLYADLVINNPDGVPILINGEKKIWKPEDPKN